jgi:hypothetical protein
VRTDPAAFRRLAVKRQAWLVVLGGLLFVGLLNPSSPARTASADNNPPNINLALNQAIADAIPAPADDPMLDANGNPVLDANGNQVSDPNEGFHKVIPSVYDPMNTRLAQSTWLDGIGCPTNAKTAMYGPPPNYPITAGPSYTDSACPTGDPKDQRNEGLLLAKTGPTSNVAAGVADLKKVKGTNVTELGYDIRKTLGPLSANGSHCGAGAPRFDVYTSDGLWFVGCDSPPADQQSQGNGYLRLRWGVSGVVMGYNSSTGLLTPITGTATRVQIVFDESYDTAPDNFGAAVLDNIDYNKTLVGRGPVGPGMSETNDNDDDD